MLVKFRLTRTRKASLFLCSFAASYRKQRSTKSVAHKAAWSTHLLVRLSHEGNSHSQKKSTNYCGQPSEANCPSTKLCSYWKVQETMHCTEDDIKKKKKYEECLRDTLEDWSTTNLLLSILTHINDTMTKHSYPAMLLYIFNNHWNFSATVFNSTLLTLCRSAFQCFNRQCRAKWTFQKVSTATKMRLWEITGKA